MYSKRGENSRGRNQKQGVSRGTSRGGRISVEKHLVSRGTVNMRELSSSKPIVPSRIHAQSLSRLRLISSACSRALIRSRLALACFTWNMLVSEFCCGVFHVERAATLRTRFVSRETLREGESRRNSRLCPTCRSADISIFFRSDQQIPP